MSTEEITESHAETAEMPEVPEVAESPEETQVSLGDVHSMSDEELETFLFNAPSSDLSVEEPFIEASEQAEPVEEAEDEIIEEEEESSESVNYKDVYEQLFNTPFKASGREIQVSTIEEARRLMQQGFDYHKKMQDMKPFNKALNVLRDRDALDPEKLSFLLDISEGKPEAIAKLLQDKELDPYQINVEEGDNYVSSYEETPEEVERVREIFNNMESGDSKLKAIKLFSDTGMDKKSQRKLYEEPEAILILKQHMDTGIYDKVMAEVDKQRALGNYYGVPDIDAYNDVGNKLTSQGKLGVPNTPTESTVSTQPKAQPNANQNDKRRKAAGAPRRAPNTVPTANAFNPATATDAEIDKFLEDQLRRAASN